MTQNEVEYDPLLRPIQVAHLLGVELSTIIRWRREHIGPDFVRLGHRTVRYRRSAVDAFIAARERGDA